MINPSPLQQVYSLYGFAVLVVLVCGGVAISGRALKINQTEEVPVSVRDNPSSWRPSYGGYSPYTRSSGSSSSSGGYSGGK
jgi:hypothetical protein